MAKIGDVIDGKYELLKEIGRGGTSIVYLAMDKRLNKEWAVKEVKKRGFTAENEEVVNSLIAEAELIKKLDHPALPRIVDIIEKKMVFFIIMDYVEGESLLKILDSFGAQPQEDVVEWGLELCDVLSYLHHQDPPIIYRDLKPANVMLTPSGDVKLIDFGAAREYKVDEKDVEDTVSLGTRGYAAPEQYGGKGQTDARTDIYNLGATLYQLLTNHNPSKKPYEIYPIRKWDKSLSTGLEKIIIKCTRKNPEERYQSAEELAEALAGYKRLDDEYLQARRVKIFKVATLMGIGAICLATGMVLVGVDKVNQNRDYKRLVAAASTSREENIKNLKRAIELNPKKPEAYKKLIEAYGENLDEKASEEFTSIYAEHKEDIDKDSEEWADLNYTIGKQYLINFSSKDNSQRNRILTAAPYFKEVVDSEQTGYKYYEAASCYCELADFYDKYLLAVDEVDISEASKGKCEKLIRSMNALVKRLDSYNESNSKHLKLTTYSLIYSLIDNEKNVFIKKGIKEDDVEGLVDTIYERTKKIDVSAKSSVEKRIYILKEYDLLKAAVREGYLKSITP